MIRLCGASLGLFAFAVTILLGLAAGNPIEAIVYRGVWAMFVFCCLGLAAGWVAYRILDEHALRMHRELFNPDEKDEASAGAKAPAPDAVQVPAAVE